MLIICPDCNQEKPHCAKGLCRSCYNRRWREANPDYQRQWNAANPERRRASERRYYECHPEKVKAKCSRYHQKHREKRNDGSRIYHWEHREEILTRKRNYHKEHQKEGLAYEREYYQKHPERILSKNARRQARKRNLPDTLTAGQAIQLLAIGQATYPGQKLELDHVVPITKGGGTTLANTHYIPMILNRSKGNKLPEELYQQNSFLDAI